MNQKIGIIIAVLLIVGVGFAVLNNGNQNQNQTEGDDVTNEMQARDATNEEAMAEEGTMIDKTIVDVAVESGQFETLVQAVTAAGLAETLSGDGPFTVFAPTDEAFAALPEGTLEALLQDTDQLAQVLTYHVVPGKVMAADVVNLSEATTVQGGAVDIVVDGDAVMVNDANVVATDIEASNGVIHIIDAVLLPQ